MKEEKLTKVDRKRRDEFLNTLVRAMLETKFFVLNNGNFICLGLVGDTMRIRLNDKGRWSIYNAKNLRKLISRSYEAVEKSSKLVSQIAKENSEVLQKSMAQQFLYGKRSSRKAAKEVLTSAEISAADFFGKNDAANDSGL